MNAEWEKVRAFQKAMEQPFRDTPKKMTKRRRTQRHKWMKEELSEFKASATVVDQVDAMIDLIYLALGTLVEIGAKPDVPFDLVHEANMNKLWADGKPRLVDGKVKKPQGWKAPEEAMGKWLEELVEL